MKWSYITAEYFTLPSDFTKQRREHLLPNLIGANLTDIPRTSDYLFPSGSGRPFSAFSKKKVELDRRSGVENFTTHDLRRTAASKAAEFLLTFRAHTGSSEISGAAEDGEPV